MGENWIVAIFNLLEVSQDGGFRTRRLVELYCQSKRIVYNATIFATTFQIPYKKRTLIYSLKFRNFNLFKLDRFSSNLLERNCSGSFVSRFEKNCMQYIMIFQILCIKL